MTYKDFAQGLLRDCEHNPKLGDIPIQFKEPIYGTSTPSFTDFVAPGVILTYEHYIFRGLSHITILTENFRLFFKY